MTNTHYDTFMFNFLNKFALSYKTYCIIFVFALLIFVTRFMALGSLPHGLQSDEASFLLNAKSLLLTGKDEDGTRLPIWFNSLIDPKPALYSYLQVPIVSLLGPSTTASRLPGFLLGVASIALVYWVLTLLTSKKLALLVTFLVTISPWHIIVTRSTQEVILSFTFSLIAIGAFLSVLKQTKKSHVIFWFATTVLAGTLAMYSYHSAKIFLPGLIFGWSLLELFVLKKPKQGNHKFWLIFSNIALLGALLFITFAVPQSVERFKAIGILSQKAPLLIAEEQIRTATGITPLPVLRFFYNKVTAYALAIVTIYTQHFSLDFLFFKGGEPQRYMIPGHGLFYHVELFLLPLGIFLSLHYERYRRWALYMLWWLLVAPLPAALTAQEVPSMIRIFPVIVPMLTFIGFALAWIWSKREFIFTKAAIGVVVIGYLWGVLYFYHQFVIQQPRYHPWYRNRAEEKLAAFLVAKESEYDLIDVSTLRDLYMYLAIYDADLITDLQQSSLARKNSEFKFNKYYFKERECAPPLYPLTQKVLYIVRANCDLPLGFKVINRFSYDDNAEVYDLVIFDASLLEEKMKMEK